MEQTSIAKGVYNVGVIDWDIRNFHGYSTDKGSSYNAFLIEDDKIVLIDTVKRQFSNALIKNISKIIDPKKIDLIISNHSEMDHSGALPDIMQVIGEKKPLYCSKMGQKNLSKHFNNKWNYHIIKDGETLSLGQQTLTFMETKMLHWPDSMFTYMIENQILFSSDAFGQHYASFDKFEDSSPNEVMIEAKKYFANILLPYTSRIISLLKKIEEMGLEIKTICPDHGVIWRKNPKKIINQYLEWSTQKGNKKAVLIYDSMWDSTKQMAKSIAFGIHQTGVEIKPINIRKSNRSDIMTEVLDANAIIVGSPTLNNQMFPTVADMLSYMKGLRPKNKIAAAFGSYGWSGEAVKHITCELKSMNFKVIDNGLKIQYVPNKTNLVECVDYGQKIGNILNDKKET